MSTLARTIEGQDWQRECHVCERVTCAKPEKVAEFLEELIAILHRQVLPDLGRRFGWRNQVAHYEALLQLYVRSWAWALKGVCPNCISKVAPELDAHMGDAEQVHEDALLRWHCLLPDFPAVGLVELLTERGKVRVPAAWLSRGLAVHRSIDANEPPGWVVSHVATGRRLAVSRPREDQKEIVALAEQLVGLADWSTLTVEAVESDSALHERIRSVVAAWKRGAR